MGTGVKHMHAQHESTLRLCQAIAIAFAIEFEFDGRRHGAGARACVDRPSTG